jgi:glycosyltransferase involved in cell wall biosynthesis
MNFIFYQNILSIHQSAFIRSLADNHFIVLIVPEELDETRVSQGWLIPDFGKTHIVINPNDGVLNQYLSQKDAIHVFTGIDSFKLPAKAFKIAVKNKLKIGVMMEPFNWLGWKGKVRFLKYLILKLKYNRKIDFILAIGNRGRWCYEKTGFSKTKIFDWAYSTEKQETIQIRSTSHIPTILFIGSIDKRKNILALIDACFSITEKSFIFNIIGNGPLENELKNRIEKVNNICYWGFVPNIQIAHYIENADVLILPSIFDGWGAVVNEALMCGTPVITSDNCGASVLLDNKKRGSIFSIKKNNLQETMVDFLKQLPYSLVDRHEIKKWAIQSISGEVVTNYFEQICEYCYGNSNVRPIAPWMGKS